MDIKQEKQDVEESGFLGQPATSKHSRFHGDVKSRSRKQFQDYGGKVHRGQGQSQTFGQDSVREAQCDIQGQVFQGQGQPATGMSGQLQGMMGNISGMDLQSMMHFMPNSWETDTRNYRCKMCTASFKTKPGLELHEAKHKGEKHHCKMCSAVFFHPRYLQQHMYSKHGIRSRFSCYICKGRMSSLDSLLSHLKSCHGVDAPSGENL